MEAAQSERKAYVVRFSEPLDAFVVSGPDVEVAFNKTWKAHAHDLEDRLNAAFEAGKRAAIARAEGGVA